MSIEDLRQKIKGWGGFVKKLDFSRFFSNIRMPELSQDLFLALVVVLVGFASFGLGRLSKIEDTRMPVRIEGAPFVTPETFSTKNSGSDFPENTRVGERMAATQSAQLVGSKNGTKYHYPWCSGAARITEANRIYFASKSDAEKAGYTPASNCKGL